jgi:hypothetical protein
MLQKTNNKLPFNQKIRYRIKIKDFMSQGKRPD